MVEFESCAMSPGSDTETGSSAIDLGLLLRIATRDEGALAEFYDRHSRLQCHHAHSPQPIGRGRGAARDLRARLVARRDLQRVAGSPAAWLIRIARNRAIDLLRARRARANVAVEPAAPVGTDAAHSIEPVTRDTPETALAGHAMADAVRAALATLMPEQRELIEAAFFEGYTHTELAARFGVPLGTVKTRIRTGLGTMRDRLEQVI
jgi:RNA polymerase sigma-70 factor, ECF subfamily